MNPLGIGVAVAVVMAGPALYGLTENGSIDGTGAILRGLAVAVVVAVGANWIMNLAARYRRQQIRLERQQALLQAIEQAETARRRAEAAAAEAQRSQASG